MFTTPFTFMNQAAAGTLSCVVQCFTSNTTWTCCPGTVCVEVVAVGGGGGGAAGLYTAGPNCPGAGGGGAGGVTICTLTSGFGSSECIVIGNGGARGPACTGGGCVGGNGGTTCFGTLVSAPGGAGGDVAGRSTRAAGGCGNQGASSYGGAGGPICVNGEAGQTQTGFPGGGGSSDGTRSNYVQPAVRAGGGASTICGLTLGAGGASGLTKLCLADQTITDGASGCNYGAGGGGGGPGYRASPGLAGAGGTGAPGIMKVTQYILS